MMDVVCLSASDRRLLCARFTEHENSHPRMIDALGDVAAGTKASLHALRCLERRFDLDLAEICHRHARRQDADTHPIERAVLDFIAEERMLPAGDVRLFILPQRVRQLRELMEGRLFVERES